MPLPGTKGTGHQCSHFGTRVQGPIRIRPLQTQFRVRIFADLKLDPWFPDFMSGIRTNMEKPRTFSIFRFFSEDERICNFFESWFNCPRNSVIRTNCYLYCHLHLKRGINAQLRHWLATNVLINWRTSEAHSQLNFYFVTFLSYFDWFSLEKNSIINQIITRTCDRIQFHCSWIHFVNAGRLWMMNSVWK